MTPFHTRIKRFGALYILAAVLEIPWPVMILTHWQSVQKFTDVMDFWWVFWVVIGGMLWLIPHLAIIGIKLIQIGRDGSLRIHQSKRDADRMRWVRNLLLLGMGADLFTIPLLWGTNDEGLVVFLFLILGTRVLWVNGEAVINYHFR